MPYSSIKAQRAYQKKWYQEHKAEHKRRGKNWRKENKSKHKFNNQWHYEMKRLLVRWLKECPCGDCQRTFPVECMDFDHVSGVKVIEIAHAVTALSLNDLIREIEKCDLVCACCHRIRTEHRK